MMTKTMDGIRRSMKHVAFILLVVWALTANASAQTSIPKEKSPLPAGPLLKHSEDFSTWQISYHYGTDKKPAANSSPTPMPVPVIVPNTVSTARPRRLVVTRTASIWYAVIEGIDGRKTENWSNGTFQVFKSDGMPDPLQVMRDVNNVAMFPDYGKVGFPDMDWVSASTYTGVEATGGRDCLVFQKGEMKVFINLETRYPVYWNQGDEVRTFTELAPPTQTLELPASVAKVAKSLQQDAVRARRLPPP